MAYDPFIYLNPNKTLRQNVATGEISSFGNFYKSDGTISGWGWTPVAPVVSQPGPGNVSTATGVNPTETQYSLYGHTIPLLVLGQGRVGGDIISGPWVDSGFASGINSFGVQADPTRILTLVEVAFDSMVVWEGSQVGNGTLASSGFSTEPFTCRFYTGSLTQPADELETGHFGADAVAYRGQVLLAINRLPLAATKFGKYPYVACKFVDQDGEAINFGEAFERLAYSPYVGLTPDQFETVGITDGVANGGMIIVDQAEFLATIQQFGRFYPKWSILQTDKLRIVDRGDDITPDVVLDRSRLVDKTTLFRQEPNSVPGILELSTIDPDADYTIVPSRAQSPRSPVAVTSSVQTDTAYLPVVMDAATRISLVTYAKHHEDRARKQINATAMFFGVEIEPGDYVGIAGLGPDFPGGETFRVLETLHGANYVVEFTAESILQCSVTSLTTAPPPPPPFLGPYASFDGTPSNVTVSNGNLTATHSNTSDGGARSTSSLNSGKYFFSVTIGASNGPLDCIGILPPSNTYSDIPGVAGIVYAVNSSIGAAGPIFITGTWSTYALGLASAGDVIDVAVDFNIARIWFRKNGGFWNGWIDGDPVLGSRGIGPFNPSSLSWAPVISFSGGAMGNNFTANFGASPFPYEVPSGYTAGWPQ